MAYYVTVIDGSRWAPVVGPFAEHEQALAKVDAAREATYKQDPKSWFYAYGTAKLPEEYTKPGSLNTAVGM